MSTTLIMSKSDITLSDASAIICENIQYSEILWHIGALTRINFTKQNLKLQQVWCFFFFLLKIEMCQSVYAESSADPSSHFIENCCSLKSCFLYNSFFFMANGFECIQRTYAYFKIEVMFLLKTSKLRQLNK